MTIVVTEDRLLDGRLLLRQPAEGFRAAIDAVFLAAAVRAKAGERALEVGSGSGAAALCLAARVEGVCVTGLDSDRALTRLASENADANGMSRRVQFFHGDLLAPPLRLAPASFDHVFANPPYRVHGRGRAPADPLRAAATIEDAAKLPDWLGFCLSMLRPNGWLTLVYAADRLDELIAALAGRLGGLALFPLWLGGGKPAKRVLARGRRGGQGPLALLPGLVLHRPDGRYTEDAERILRGGEAVGWE